MKDVKSVSYNDGSDDLFALVVADNGGGSLDLLVFDRNGGAGHQKDVPRRDPADYDAGGGGHTWHP